MKTFDMETIEKKYIWSYSTLVIYTLTWTTTSFRVWFRVWFIFYVHMCFRFYRWFPRSGSGVSFLWLFSWVGCLGILGYLKWQIWCFLGAIEVYVVLHTTLLIRMYRRATMKIYSCAIDVRSISSLVSCCGYVLLEIMYAWMYL